MSDKLKIKIYRGANQIGGCATEICCGEERILIDLGANLPGTDETVSISDRELVSKVFDGRPCKGVLFTHYHGDHYGLYGQIPDNIPMYIGEAAKEIISVVAKTLYRVADKDVKSIAEYNLKKITNMETYCHGKPIFKTGKIQVTPIMTDHSAMDAYMFLVEAEGKKILFTGDFRDHGIASENNRFWENIAEQVPNDVDILITEGTMMTRDEEAKLNLVHTEEELGEKAGSFLEEADYNFVLVSSTNLDTIMELYRNTPRNKMFIVDTYQAEIMLTAMELRKDVFEQYGAYEVANGKYCRPVYIIGKREEGTDNVYISGPIMMKLRERAEMIHPKFHIGYADYKRMREKGIVMLIRPNRYREKYESCFEEVIREFSFKDMQLLYSMWKGYIEGSKVDEDILYMTKLFSNRIDLHTSGHAYVETIAKLINTTKPKKVIPMHTEFAKGFQEKKEFEDCTAEVIFLKDMESYVLE